MSSPTGRIVGPSLTCSVCGREAKRLLRTACDTCYGRARREGTVESIAKKSRPDLTLRTHKTCPGCDCRLPVTAFSVSRDRADGREGWCRGCHAARRAERDMRAYELRRKYGMTHDDYDRLLEAQDGGCAICGSAESPDAGFLSVDHDHATGQVRGLLCGPCNKAIGLLKDDIHLLGRAAAYLRRWCQDV